MNGVLVLKGLLKELIVICDSESLKVLALWSFPCEGIELGYFRVLFRVVVAAIGHKVKLFIYWYASLLNNVQGAMMICVTEQNKN